jgi:predicted RNA-binding Zn ribbon-like protein
VIPVERIPYEPREHAPGGLRLVEELVNTVDYEHRREVLHEPAQLRRLLVGLGLLDAGARVSAADLRRAHEMREALRALLLENNGGPRDEDAYRMLESVADAGRLSVRFGADGAELVPAASDVKGALARIVGVVATSMADGTWPRMKACRREVCGWAFYDRSRNRSSAWCQMSVCGNRTKTRAYRERRRSSPV